MTRPYALTFVFSHGRLVLELGSNYACCHSVMQAAAEDLASYLAGEDPSGWEDHEPDLLGYSGRVAGEGYRIYTDVADVLADADDDCGWVSLRAFAVAWEDLEGGNPSANHQNHNPDGS